MRLYFVRHAEAVARGVSGFADDAKRPLTDEGCLQARLTGQAFKRLRIPVDLLLTSPCVRARQTAEAIAQALGMRLKELPALAGELSAAESSSALKPFSSHGHVVLVGHEPHLSGWIGELIGGKDAVRALMKKGGAACVAIERVPPPSGSGTLRWWLTPKQIALIAKSK